MVGQVWRNGRKQARQLPQEQDVMAQTLSLGLLDSRRQDDLRAELSQADKAAVHKLCYLYVFFAANYSGVDFKKEYDATRSLGDFLPPNRTVDHVFVSRMAESCTLASIAGEFLQNRFRTGMICLADRMNAWTRFRGLPPEDIVLLYVLEKQLKYFTPARMEMLPAIADKEGSNLRTVAEKAGILFDTKSTPSLEANNRVAAELYHRPPLTWEELGMDRDVSGMYSWTVNRLARFGFEHPIITRIIPVYGAVWSAMDSFQTMVEGRDAEGNRSNRFFAGASFAFHMGLAFLDATAVVGLTGAAARGVGAIRAQRLLGKIEALPRTLEGARRAKLLIGVEQQVVEEAGETALRAGATEGTTVARTDEGIATAESAAGRTGAGTAENAAGRAGAGTAENAAGGAGAGTAENAAGRAGAATGETAARTGGEAAGQASTAAEKSSADLLRESAGQPGVSGTCHPEEHFASAGQTPEAAARAGIRAKSAGVKARNTCTAFESEAQAAEVLDEVRKLLKTDIDALAEGGKLMRFANDGNPVRLATTRQCAVAMKMNGVTDACAFNFSTICIEIHKVNGQLRIFTFFPYP